MKKMNMTKTRCFSLHAACVALLLAAAGPAHAIDCRKAGNRVEHMICADARLKAADAEMGKAYAALVQQAGNDAELRAMLVRSQKRWIEARDTRFDSPMDYPGAPDAAALPRNLLQEMRRRTRTLSEPGKTDRAVPRLLEVAQAQRKFLAQFTGGPFAGFATSCDFLPGGQQLSYGCFSDRSYQHHERVCTLRDDWASGSYYQTRLVGNVVQGRLQTVAACGDGSEGGSPCPEADGSGRPGARWNLQPGIAASTPKPSPKLDAEAELEADDTAWLRACLTDARYPQGAAR